MVTLHVLVPVQVFGCYGNAAHVKLVPAQVFGYYGGGGGGVSLSVLSVSVFAFF